MATIRYSCIKVLNRRFQVSREGEKDQNIIKSELIIVLQVVST